MHGNSNDDGVLLMAVPVLLLLLLFSQAAGVWCEWPERDG
jgi:hypothetical protein